MESRRKANMIELYSDDIRMDKEQVKLLDNDNLPQQQRTDALAHLFLSYRAWLKNKFKDVIQ